MAKVLLVVVLLAGGSYWLWGGQDAVPAQAGGKAVVLDPAQVQGQVHGQVQGADLRATAENLGVDQGGAPAGRKASPSQRPGPPDGSVRRGSKAGAKLDGAQGQRRGSPADPIDTYGNSDGGPSSARLMKTDDRSARAAKPSEQTDALLLRAMELGSQGDAQGAASLLRDGMSRSKRPQDVARMGLFLAKQAVNPAEARRLLTNALQNGVVFDAEYEVVSDQLQELNRSTGGSLLPLLQVQEYVVEANDNLWTLCNKVFPKEYSASPEVGLIQLLNGMAGTNLRVGETLAIPLEDVRVEVDRGNHGLVVYLGNVALAAYRVGLGKENRTPSGEFQIEVKLEEPTWHHDGRVIPFGDPANILGTRWLGFENKPGVMGYGIHGTAHPESVGSDESMGCVRMRNEEVEELFGLVPRGTKVSIP